MSANRTADVEIRTQHRYGYRMNEWAHLCGVVMYQPNPGTHWRACYDVVFPDGIRDLWVVDDPDGHYEFRVEQ